MADPMMTPGHIGIEGNEKADSLAKKAPPSSQYRAVLDSIKYLDIMLLKWWNQEKE